MGGAKRGKGKESEKNYIYLECIINFTLFIEIFSLYGYNNGDKFYASEADSEFPTGYVSLEISMLYFHLINVTQFVFVSISNNSLYYPLI